MKHGALLLLGLTLVLSAHALTVGEKSAIEAIFNHFPVLGQSTPPWTSNASEACSEPPFYGLSCSDTSDPHVVSLYVALEPSQKFAMPMRGFNTSYKASALTSTVLCLLLNTETCAF